MKLHLHLLVFSIPGVVAGPPVFLNKCDYYLNEKGPLVTVGGDTSSYDPAGSSAAVTFARYVSQCHLEFGFSKVLRAMGQSPYMI